MRAVGIVGAAMAALSLGFGAAAQDETHGPLGGVIEPADEPALQPPVSIDPDDVEGVGPVVDRPPGPPVNIDPNDVAGATDAPFTLRASHNPAYFEEAHVSTITARAEAPEGVSLIVIGITEGDLVSCPTEAGDLPSIIPCRDKAYQRDVSCELRGEGSAECDATVQLNANRIVTYQAKAVTSRGRTMVTTPVTYSGGERAYQTYCWYEVGLPTAALSPIFVTRECSEFSPLAPIWWEVTEPPGGSTAPPNEDQLDIVFYQDRNDFMGDEQSYSEMLSAIADEVIFHPNDTASWAGQDFTNDRSLFAYWSGPRGGDGLGGGDQRFYGAARFTSSYADNAAVIHDNSNQKKAWATIARGGSSWLWGIDYRLPQIFVHESGHALFALDDEYEGGGANQNSIPRNTHTSKSDCESVAVSIGVSPGLCVKFTDDEWRITDGSPDVMETVSDPNTDWRDASEVARRRIMDLCRSGDCY